VAIGKKTSSEPSTTKLLLLVAVILIAAVSIIQGAYLPGILAAIGVLVLYYFATWVKQGEERVSRVDLMDQRLVDLEKRVTKIEDREDK
jgi:predicted PurR-regulated permease PerM